MKKKDKSKNLLAGKLSKALMSKKKAKKDRLAPQGAVA
jgi:hypothetical protein